MTGEKITIKNRILSGSIDAKKQPSKSILIRLLIMCLISDSHLEELAFAVEACEDTKAVYNCIEKIRSGDLQRLPICSCAAGLRMLIPVCIAKYPGKTISFVCNDDLLRRGKLNYGTVISDFFCKSVGNVLTVSGVLSPGNYSVSSEISSQYASGALLALSVFDVQSSLSVKKPVSSESYLNMTVKLLEKTGAEIKTDNLSDKVLYSVCGCSNDVDYSELIEGDWSYAANFYIANALGASLKVHNLKPYNESMQGDSIISKLLYHDENDKEELNISDFPDLFMLLCVLFSVRKGKILLTGVERLKNKECDRLNYTVTELKKLGADIKIIGKGVEIIGRGTKLCGGCVDSHGDHRMAMALCIASIACEKPVVLSNYDVVKKSAPNFFEDFVSLGGSYELIR